MSDKTTARPWYVGNHPNDDSGLNWREILTDALEFSPSYVGQMQKEDAELTVRAVNSHDALVDALTLALPYVESALEDQGYKPGVVDRMTKTIRAALELADSKN